MPHPAVARFSDLLRRYFEYALPIRLAIGGVITLIAGTGFGFIAEYAAYSWAIYYGIRPPLEGIPYLKIAVTGLTAVIFFGGAALYFFAHAAAGALLNYVSAVHRKISGYEKTLDRLLSAPESSHVSDWMLEKFKSLSFTAALLTSASISFGFVALIALISHFQNLPPKTAAENSGLFLLLLLGLLLLWNKNSQTWFAIISVFILTIGVPAAFFHVDSYSRLLRLLGYGGGLPIIVVVVEDPGSNRDRTQVDGYLMLRTTSALLVYEPAKNRIREISLQQVLFLDHAARPLSERHPKLPI
jgi:hypothetical protein